MPNKMNSTVSSMRPCIVNKIVHFSTALLKRCSGNYKFKRSAHIFFWIYEKFVFIFPLGNGDARFSILLFLEIWCSRVYWSVFRGRRNFNRGGLGYSRRKDIPTLGISMSRFERRRSSKRPSCGSYLASCFNKYSAFLGVIR